MTYLNEVLESHLLIENSFYDYLYESMEIESDFINMCLENNIILEADEDASAKDMSWWEKLKSVIANIFKKFSEVAQDLFKVNEKWIDKESQKLFNTNYNGLAVDVIPYWNMKIENIDGILAKFASAMTNPPRKFPDTVNKEYVEGLPVFKQYTKNKDVTFAEKCKTTFKTNGDLKAVHLEGEKLKEKCTGEMLPYVKRYMSSVLPTMKKSVDRFNNNLSVIERELKQRNAVMDSFCILENCSFAETELRYCYNFRSVMEAETSSAINKVSRETKQPSSNTDTNSTKSDKTNNDKTDDKPLNRVERNSDVKGHLNSDETKKMSTPLLQYYRIVTQMNQVAIAAAMTVTEECFRSYMQVLKDVVKK